MAVAMTAAILLLVLQCNPSWASEKIPARVSPLPLLEAPLLQAQTVSRHKRLGDLGSEPQSLEGIYYLCLLALNHPPCSQQANISLVHSSTDDGAVTALLALETLTNFSSSWSLAFLMLSFYIQGFLSLLCHLSSHPSLVCLPSILAQPALPAPLSQPRDTDTWLGCSKKSRFWVHLPSNLLKCLKWQTIFHWRNIFFNLFLAVQK